MKKDLLLITSHCSTPEKKDTLLSLLKSLQKFRSKFDILVTSHLPLDPMFFTYFDFFFFDVSNNVLTSQEFTQNAWFQPFDNYVIWSSYADYGNTMVAIWDLIIPAVSIAKSHEYKKIHHIEYDTLFMNDDELIENSKLLDDYDYVIYSSNNSHPLLGAFFSFKVSSIIEEWEKIDHNYLKKLISQSYPKAPERLFYNILSQKRKFYRKEIDHLTQQGIQINLSRGSKIYWEVPFYEPKTQKLKFISWNLNGENYSTKVIVNNEKLYKISNLPLRSWRLIDLSENFDDVETLQVFRNNQLVIDIFFDNQKIKSDFKYYNSVLDNTSISTDIVI